MSDDLVRHAESEMTDHACEVLERAIELQRRRLEAYRTGRAVWWWGGDDPLEVLEAAAAVRAFPPEGGS